MDSQITLVNTSPPFQLDSSKKSLLNTTLTSQGRPIYSISTVVHGSDVTYVKDAATKRVLATISHNTFLPDTVTFADYYGGKAIRLSKWLSEIKSPDALQAAVIETDQGKFIWRVHPVHRLALFSESDAENPLAREVVKARYNSSLIMEHGTEPFRLQILVSFLVMEQRLRGTEASWEVGYAVGQTVGKVNGIKSLYAP